MTRHWLLRAAAIVFATTHLSCSSDQGPGAATGVSQPPLPTALYFGTPGAQNVAPNLRVRTSPEASYATNPPTISGTAPLTVTFNLCPSDDPDAGDSLNWQFNFGDSGRPPFNPDGSFNRDTDQTCKVDHTYRAGTYTAWVSVTDKHLEDQSRDVSSLARKSQAFTVQAGAASTSDGSCPSILDLGGPASGSLAIVPGHRLWVLFSLGGVGVPPYPTILTFAITPVTYSVPAGFNLRVVDLDCNQP